MALILGERDVPLTPVLKTKTSVRLFLEHLHMYLWRNNSKPTRLYACEVIQANRSRFNVGPASVNAEPTLRQHRVKFSLRWAASSYSSRLQYYTVKVLQGYKTKRVVRMPGGNTWKKRLLSSRTSSIESLLHQCFVLKLFTYSCIMFIENAN